MVEKINSIKGHFSKGGKNQFYLFANCFCFSFYVPVPSSRYTYQKIIEGKEKHIQFWASDINDQVRDSK